MSEMRLTRLMGVVLQLFVIIALSLTGCARHRFDARSLPSQYAARPAFDAANTDISILSGSSFDSQQIYPGDTLRMVVVTGADGGRPEEWPVRVLDDGSVQLPMVGRLVISGYSVEVAQDLIRTASIERGIYRNPSITLVVDKRRTHRVSITGAVNDPGEYELPAGQTDLMSAILAAGGMTDDADRYIDIRRAAPRMPNAEAGPETDGSYFAQVHHQSSNLALNGPQHPSAAAGRVTRIDLVKAAQSSQPTPVRVGDGDVITVHKRPRRFIHVMGLVNKPDRFELKGNESARVLDAIAMAGGVKLSVADRILVVRQAEDSTQPVTILVSLRDAKQNTDSNILLADGDVVSVEETPVTFTMGTIQNLVRFGVNGFF